MFLCRFCSKNYKSHIKISFSFYLTRSSSLIKTFEKNLKFCMKWKSLFPLFPTPIPPSSLSSFLASTLSSVHYLISVSLLGSLVLVGDCDEALADVGLHLEDDHGKRFLTNLLQFGETTGAEHHLDREETDWKSLGEMSPKCYSWVGMHAHK